MPDKKNNRVRCTVCATGTTLFFHDKDTIDIKCPRCGNIHTINKIDLLAASSEYLCDKKNK